MREVAFRKWLASLCGTKLTHRQKVYLANALGFLQDKDYHGQLLFYTDLKEDEKSGRLRRLRDSDFR